MGGAQCTQTKESNPELTGAQDHDGGLLQRPGHCPPGVFAPKNDGDIKGLCGNLGQAPGGDPQEATKLVAKQFLLPSARQRSRAHRSADLRSDGRDVDENCQSPTLFT